VIDYALPHTFATDFHTGLGHDALGFIEHLANEFI
jgi:hypothetical protein